VPAEIRAVIADDEPLARLRLSHLCARAGDVSVVAEATNGDEALAKVNELEPHLLFLDMQMPGRDGLSVGASLRRARRPLVVYVTAYAEYAVSAFAVDAVDYLLKPFDKGRFEITLARVRERLAAAPAQDSNTPSSLARPSPVAPAAERLAVRSGWRTRFIDVNDVDYVAAEGNYVAVHVGDKSFLLRETMSAMEKRLEAAGFVRVHRSSLVRIDRIDEIEPIASGDYVLRLKGGQTVAVTRSYRRRLLAALGLDR
jgi:two-component system LytT family response regulator